MKHPRRHLSARPTIIFTALVLALAATADLCAQPADTAMQEKLKDEAIVIIRQVSHRATARSNIAMLRSPILDSDLTLIDIFADELNTGGMNVCYFDVEQLSNPYALSPEYFDILVLPNAPVIPREALPSVARYLQRGGSVIASGLPAFSRLAGKFQGKWMDREGALEMLNATKPDKVLFDFDEMPDSRQRSTDDKQSKATYRVNSPGAPGSSKALHATIRGLSGWDTIALTPPSKPFENNRTLTCFWAKGDAGTTKLSIEWVEKDGSRWIATVPLERRWRHYALAPMQFKYWHDSPTGRRRADSRFDPANASKLVLGLSSTHTGPAGARHSWAVDELGTAASPDPGIIKFASEQPPKIELLSPGYKFYTMTDVRNIGLSKRQSLVSRRRLPVPASMISSHVRPQGTGFNKARKWRWVPLIEATDSQNRRCGFPAAMMIHSAGPAAGGIWVALPYSQKELRGSRSLRKLIKDLALAITRGVFLIEGGSEWYTYFEDQNVVLGATVANFGREDAKATVEISVKAPDGTSMLGRDASFPVSLSPGKRQKVQLDWKPKRQARSGCQVEVELTMDGKVIDSLRHELNFWKPQRTPRYVTAHDEDFYIGPNKWHPHGVNYMPSSGVATEDGEYFEYWLDPQPYDPDVIDVDLDRIASLKMNAVSVFVYHRSLDSGNLLDLLRRCEERNLRVNLSLRPGTPLDFKWEQMKALIRKYRLKQHDNIFAYDIAWEPMWRQYKQRVRWDRQWAEWIKDRYGSLANAERDWGFPCPKSGGRITGPSDRQVSQDGEWRKMVAAYRMFLDCLLSRHCSKAVRLIKSIDPNHLVSFRMSLAGDPTADPARGLAYDFRGLAKSMDIMCPEGYGRIGDWERVRPGHFTAAWSRLVAPGRPMMWAEFGLSAWDNSRMQVNPQLLQKQAQLYKDFYRMVIQSGASGSFCWWYPGGFRLGENSDYGIVNPDGTMRPAAEVIRTFADKIARRPARNLPKVQITVDRDAHPDGIHGIYEAVKDEYWAAVDNGRFPELKTAATGKDSCTVPIAAVGNGEYTKESPPKYLNAEFYSVEILDASGRWREVRDGDSVNVKAHQPVKMRVEVGNTGDVAWLGRKSAAGRRGVVAIGSRARRSLRFIQPIPDDVPPLTDLKMGEFALPRTPAARTRIVLEMNAVGRAWFGETIEVTLEPTK